MKPIGFYREIEKDKIGDLISYDPPKHAVILSEDQLRKVLAYLESGRYVFGLTLALLDKDGSLIGGYEILTDGEWLWPKYFAYFLDQQQVKSIDADFFRSIERNKFQVPEVSDAVLKEADVYFQGLLRIKLEQRKKEKRRGV